MDKKEITKSLNTLKEMCNTTPCCDCPLGFCMNINNIDYYKCVLMYYSPRDLQILKSDEVWRATYQTKILEEQYGKTDKGTGC